MVTIGINNKEYFKRVLIVFSILFLFFAIFIIGYNSTEIYDATVDESSGNIAIVYRTNQLMIAVYDFNGNIILEHPIDSDGYALVDYNNNGELNIFVLRTKSTYCLTMNGELTLINKDVYLSDKEVAWKGWEKMKQTKLYSVIGGYYKYDQGTYWNRRFCNYHRTLYFYSEGGEEILLWSD